MIAEILSTGEEIRSGATIDSNSAFIAQRLEETGLNIVRHLCVGDDTEIIAATLTEIGNRADIAVVTGGLGPTEDDLTTKSAAKAAGVELKLDETALASIKDYFVSRNRPMNPSNRKQALLPEGADYLCNPVGTAPGFQLKIGRCLFYFLPGVPLEMRRMMTHAVVPAIEDLWSKDKEYVFSRTITTFGLTESMTGERLVGFSKQFPKIQLGFRVKFPEIHIKFYTRGKDSQDLLQYMEKAANWVSEKMGKKIISLEGDSMEKWVGGLLSRRNATLAVSESCTGGLLSHLITNVAGSSNYFLLSAVTYSNEAKINVLGVSPETLKQFGAVHEETAKEMAAGIRRIAGSSFAISTSGISGPDGGTEDKPVGTVCIGLATPHATTGRRFILNRGDRWRNKQIFAIMALDLLRRELLYGGDQS